MSILKDKLHRKRIDRIKFKTNLSKEIIDDILDLSFEFLRKKLNSPEVPKDKLLTKEEFDDILPIIKVPTLGYFKPNYYKYKAIYRREQKKLNQNK